MKKAQKTEFRSIHGSVIVYTRRHINGCKLRDRNENRCSCPKWLYSKPKNGRAVQRAAGTPSFTEASEAAQRLLKGFDPEIAKARQITEPKLGVTIEDAIALYEASLGRRALSAKYVANCLLPFTRRKRRPQSGRVINVSLLDFLDKENRAAREPVVRVEQITSDHLDRWAAEWVTNDLSSHVWRGTVRAFFKWARRHDHVVREPEFREPQRVRPGNRCGYFSDGQYAKMRAALPFCKMKFHAMPENFAARLGAFMDAGRWGGMAITDIVFFAPRVSLGDNNVLTYRRRKSGVVASVLLPPEVAARLRSIPPEAGSDPERPFRFGGSEAVNCQRWRARFKALCTLAGVTEIETENGAKLAPHVHALRDTFAIDAITRGVALENVARMLGHATTQMTQRSYLFWIKKRVDHCIEDQREALAQCVQPAPEAEGAETEKPALIQ
jgi:integrase